MFGNVIKYKKCKWIEEFNVECNIHYNALLLAKQWEMPL